MIRLLVTIQNYILVFVAMIQPAMKSINCEAISLSKPQIRGDRAIIYSNEMIESMSIQTC